MPTKKAAAQPVTKTPRKPSESAATQSPVSSRPPTPRPAVSPLKRVTPETKAVVTLDIPFTELRIPVPQLPDIVVVPVLGWQFSSPRPESAVFYVVVGGLAAASLVDWPIALVVAAGHALATSKNRVLEEIGEAVETV